MATKKQEQSWSKATVGASLAIILVACVGSVWTYRYIHREQSLVVAIAEALNAKPGAIELNLPPVGNRYPGAVLVSPELRQSVVLRPGQREGEPAISLQ